MISNLLFCFGNGAFFFTERLKVSVMLLLGKCVLDTAKKLYLVDGKNHCLENSAVAISSNPAADANFAYKSISLMGVLVVIMLQLLKRLWRWHGVCH